MTLAAAERTQELRRAGLGAAGCQLLLLPASVRHWFFYGADVGGMDLHQVLHAFELLSLIVWLAGTLWFLRLADRCLAAPGAPDRTALVLRLGLVLAFVATLPLPLLSEDPISYLGRGRVLAVHGENPYLVTAQQITGRGVADPMLAAMKGWGAETLPYGPLVALLQGAIAWLTELPAAFLPWQLRLWAGVWLFKLAAAMALWATACVLASLLDRERDRDGRWRRDRLLLWFAWNPFLLVETAGSGHNDVLVALPLALAVLAATRERFAAATVWLTASALVKFVTVLLAPLLLVLAWRRRRLRPLIGGVLASAAACALSWWVFWSEPGGMAWLTDRMGIPAVSLQAFAASVFGLEAKVAQRLGLGVTAAVVLWSAWRLREAGELPGRAMHVLVALIVFGMPFAYPWYALWWAPLAVLAGLAGLAKQRHLACLLVITVLGPLSYGVYLWTRAFELPHQVLQWLLAVLLPAVPLLWPHRGGAGGGRGVTADARAA